METTSTSASNRSEPGRLLGLRNWRVRSKLIAVLVIPAVAFLVLASFGIGASVRNAQAFDRDSRLAELGREVTALVHELQAERDLGAGFVAGRQAGDGDLEQALAAQQRRVDQLAARYREAEAPLGEDLGGRLQGRFDAVRASLDDLPGLREAARSAALTERAIFEEYSQTVRLLLGVTGEIAEAGGDEDLAQQVRAFNDLAQAKELTSQVRGTLYAIALGGGFAFREFRDFSNLLAEQQAAFDQFQAEATGPQRGLFADVVQGQAVLAVNRIQQEAVDRQSQRDLRIDPQQWLAASTTEIELLRTVEGRLLDGVVGVSQDLTALARRDALRDAVLIALILAVALLALLVVARSMAEPLQRLRAGAMEIAERRLPDAVQRLRTTESGDLDVRVEPLGIRSKDEIGQVAQAVDAIQEVAVRVATEQAALRRSIGDMFTNLARRSQTLIDRQLELIDDLERNETDPDTLEHLFRLDHLATRMRRNAEDLIVLSGADPGRHWVQPMTLVDVVRAAAAEVEEYQRVEFLPMADIEVAGHATVDVIHLLAELVENATAFSPPNTKVQIAGQAVPHGYVIEIEDRGLGMSDEELIQANERLANPPEIDFALSRVLGLYVVGRLGLRHGIKVQLRHSWYGGVTALTLLPPGVLVWPTPPPAMPEPATPGAAGQGRAELPSPERAPEPAPATDHLPIFEAARSDWFVTEPGPTHRGGSKRPDLPGHPPGRAARPTGGPPWGPPDPPGRTPPAEPPQPVPAEPPQTVPADRSQTVPEDEPAPAAPPAAAGPAPRLTQAGLPRRVPRTNLAPGMVATEQAPGQPPPAPAAGRSPDEVRSMLSSYRTGIERGRTVAGGSDSGQRPPDAS
jgi:HAMP domain-containing protein